MKISHIFSKTKLVKQVLRPRVAQLEMEVADLTKNLAKTSECLERVCTRVRLYVRRVATTWAVLERWREEALTRFVVCGLVTEKWRACAEVLRQLKVSHEAALQKAEEDAKLILQLKDEIADLEVQLSKTEKQRDFEKERKKHWAERARMGVDELGLMVSVRIALEYDMWSGFKHVVSVGTRGGEYRVCL